MVMRVALISDIHGNLTAFETVLAALEHEAVDQVVFLGDAVSTGPQPHECLQRLRDLGCPCVMGNGDAEILDLKPPKKPGLDYQRFYEIDCWCAAQLTPDDCAMLASFRPTVELSLGGATLLCYHGSPRSYDECVQPTTPDDELDAMFTGQTALVLVGGHTHIQMLRRYRESYLINPGSVGLAYEVDAAGTAHNRAWAEYALLDVMDGALAFQLRRLPYDGQAVVRTAVERGMPHAAWWGRDL